MKKTTSLPIVLLLAAGLSLSSAAVAGQPNPIDRISNPSALEYPDVEVRPEQMNPPFIRQGFVIEPERVRTIKPGVSEAEVRAALGDPLRGDGMPKGEWDYEVKFKMPQSQNFLICQYKVLFNADRLVRGTVWRRQQCKQYFEGELIKE